jgi:hypothetical protein
MPAAVKGLVTTAAADATTGAVVYWQLSGACDRAALAAAWAAAGLPADWLPAPASSADALRRAVKALESPAMLVRRHPKGGWQAVAESRVDGKLGYSTGTRFFIDGDEAKSDPPDGAGAQAVFGAFGAALLSIAPQDASSWLVRIAARLGAVLLRETGGIYFVPRGAIDRLHAIKGAIAAACGHQIYEIPAVHSAEVVQAVFAALQREVAEEIEALEADITNEACRGTTLAARAAHCNGVVAKVADFERLLGAPAGDAIARLQDLKARLAIACKAKLSRIEMLEIDAPLTDEELAAITAAAKANAERRRAAKAAAAAPAPAPTQTAIEEQGEPTRIGLLEVD